MLTYSNMGGGSLKLNCNKKKGFTLIELLAVIVILALVAVIATPIITGIIEDSKKETVKRSVENISSAAQIYIANEELANRSVPKGKNIYDAVSKEISGSKPEYAEIISDGIGNIAYAILFGNNCYKKTYDGVESMTETTDCKIRSELPEVVDVPTETDIFFNSGLRRNQIEKIVMLDTNTVPEEYTSNSFKLTEDGNIMGYYTDVDENGLYEMYIGSSSGMVVSNKNSQFLFYLMSNLKEIDLTNFDTSNTGNMRSLFYGCQSLENIDLSNFVTSKATNMRAMFSMCKNLVELDLSNFDTSDVTTMRNMFFGCQSLTSIDISNFDTSNVIDMGQMFYECSGLKSINLSGFNTSKLEDMIDMFYGCSSLTSIDLSSFDTSNVTNMLGIFYDCTSLTSVDLSNFNTAKVTDIRWMFYNCPKITTTITINNPNITSYVEMFTDAATAAGSQITVNYIDSTSSLVDNMINTKSDTSNVIKGEKVN